MQEKRGIVESEQHAPLSTPSNHSKGIAPKNPSGFSKSATSCCGGRCKTTQAQDAVADAVRDAVKR
jgi:hypothetical protein